MTSDPLAQVVPAPPRVSPDGRFYLDQGRWVPFPIVGQDRKAVAAGVSEGILTVVGQLTLILFVFPVVGAVVISLVMTSVPTGWAAIFGIATLVVLLGCLWKLIRAMG